MTIDIDRKVAGLLVPVFALRRDGDLGIGDTAAVKDAIDACVSTGISVLQILPINETGGDNSPYNAISAMALDPVSLTVAPGVVPGLSKENFDNQARTDFLKTLGQGSVSYPLVKKLKLDLLESAYNSFAVDKSREAQNPGQNPEQNSERHYKDFSRFKEENADWLDHYTLFRALIDVHQGNSSWTQWPAEYQTYESARGAVDKSADKEKISRKRDFFAFVQWIAYSQWQDVKDYADKKKVKLMGDIPFGVSRYSADVWGQRTLFDLGWSGGGPPETFFQGNLFVQKWGQNWGIPLYNWNEHEKQKYAWWRKRVHGLTKLFHFFRIDHVLGFFRIYSFPWIPERNWEFTELTEEEAKEKTGGRLPQFLPRPDEPEENAELNCKDGENILKILALAAGGVDIVAEDLGMVPPYVRPLLTKLHIPGFSIPIFERNEEDRSFKPKESLPKLNLATYGTHDHMPIASFYDDLVSWWHGPDGHAGWLEVQRLMKFIGWDEQNPPEEFTDDLHVAMMKTLMETPCWLAIFMITDLLGTRQRFNEPGLTGESNWSQRLDAPLTALLDDPRYRSKMSRFKKLVKDTDRLSVSKTPA